MASLTHLIAIVGGSCSGKTWLAERLVSALGPKTALASLDNFYGDLSHLTPEARAMSNFDHPNAIDWEKVREVVDAMGQGRPTPMPAYDFASHTRNPRPVSWVPQQVVIWEGLWLLYPPWLRQRFSFTVFLECPVHLRLARRCTRDVQERGRSRESVEQQFEAQVMPMHEQFVAPQRRWAQCVLQSPVSASALSHLVRRVKDLF